MKTSHIAAASSLVYAAALLSGCATTSAPMDRSQFEQVRAADEINVIYHGPIGPAVQTAGNAVAFQFSMGLAGWGTPGLQLMEENGIEDPMIGVRERLMQRLASDAGLNNLVVGNSPVPNDETKADQIQSKYGSGLHLQLVPGQWTVIYYMGNWARYHMYYGAQARLVRADDGKVLWSSRCQANQDDGDSAPDMDELMADKAARLKHWTEKAAAQCADQLAEQFIGETA